MAAAPALDVLAPDPTVAKAVPGSVAPMNLPVHNTEYEEVLFIICPRCSHKQPGSWGDLSKGEKHTCQSCGYDWLQDPCLEVSSITHGSE